MEEQNNNETPAWKNRARTAIYPMAGIYIISQAYHMFKAIPTTSGSEHILMIVFSILFVIVGGWLIYVGFAGAKKAHDAKLEEQKKIEEEK